MCIALCICLCSCAPKQNINITDSGKIIAVATIFPQYDFLREIAGDKADIYLLIPPGGESHSFEPSPSDIINIGKSDLFVYAGGNVDIWAKRILQSEQMAKTKAVSLMEMVPLICHEHEHYGESDHHGEDAHVSEHDEHVWTSPINAIKICEELCEILCEADAKNASYYIKNCNDYVQKLKDIDNETRDIIKNAKRREIVFADRFPVRYFTEEYGIEYVSAFPGCAGETEPGPQTLARLIDRVRENDIPVVFYQEFSNQKVANLVCESTKSKKMLFHSCHNLSAEDFENGETYLSLMRKNIQNLKEALR